jgi:hypothetical protein
LHEIERTLRAEMGSEQVSYGMGNCTGNVDRGWDGELNGNGEDKAADKIAVHIVAICVFEYECMCVRVRACVRACA